PGTAYIVRATLAVDGIGGRSETWGTVGTVVCDVWPISGVGSERVIGGQITSRAGWYITLPADTDVTVKDRIEESSRTFEVVFVPVKASFRTALRVEANIFNQEKRI